MAARVKARHAYLVALFRARDERSTNGLLHVGEAFAALGDIALAIHCVHIAEAVIAADPVGSDAQRERVRTSSTPTE